MRSNNQPTVSSLARCTQTCSLSGIVITVLVSLALSAAPASLLAQSNPENTAASAVAADSDLTKSNSANTDLDAPPNDVANSTDDNLPPRESEPPLETNPGAAAETSTAQTYQSSESISEDSSVSFPVDI